jgi:hypothetical protein
MTSRLRACRLIRCAHPLSAPVHRLTRTRTTGRVRRRRRGRRASRPSRLLSVEAFQPGGVADHHLVSTHAEKRTRQRLHMRQTVAARLTSKAGQEDEAASYRIVYASSDQPLFSICFAPSAGEAHPTRVSVKISTLGFRTPSASLKSSTVPSRRMLRPGMLSPLRYMSVPHVLQK